MDTSLATALGLGLLLGLRHALDADHVVAVSTMVARDRGLARSCLLGAFWGAGHTLALVAAGIGVVVFKLTITPELEDALERVVGLVLAGLGGHVVLRALGGLLVHGHAHAHDGVAHRHVHLHLGAAEGAHVHLLRLGGRPFAVGVLHGLAGSAALTLLVLGTIPSSVGALAYLGVFGIGATAGMLVLSGLIGLPVAYAARGAGRLQAAIQLVAGVGSVALGVFMLAGSPGA